MHSTELRLEPQEPNTQDKTTRPAPASTTTHTETDRINIAAAKRANHISMWTSSSLPFYSCCVYWTEEKRQGGRTEQIKWQPDEEKRFHLICQGKYSFLYFMCWCCVYHYIEHISLWNFLCGPTWCRLYGWRHWCNVLNHCFPVVLVNYKTF